MLGSDLRFGERGRHEHQIAGGKHVFGSTDGLKGCDEGVARGYGDLTRCWLGSGRTSFRA